MSRQNRTAEAAGASGGAAAGADSGTVSRTSGSSATAGRFGSAIPMFVAPLADRDAFALNLVSEDEQLKIGIVDTRSLRRYSLVLDQAGLKGCGSPWAERLHLEKIKRLLAASLTTTSGPASISVVFTYSSEKELAAIIERLQLGGSLEDLVLRTDAEGDDRLVLLFKYAPDEFTEEAFYFRLEVVNEDATDLLTRRLTRNEADLQEAKSTFQAELRAAVATFQSELARTAARHSSSEQALIGKMEAITARLEQQVAAKCDAVSKSCEAAVAAVSERVVLFRATIVRRDASDNVLVWKATTANPKALPLSTDGKFVTIKQTGYYEVSVRTCYQADYFEQLRLQVVRDSGTVVLAHFFAQVSGYQHGGVQVTECGSFGIGDRVQVVAVNGDEPYLAQETSWLLQIRRL